MPQTVYQLSKQTIQTMKQYYHKSLTTTPQGAIFRAKTPNAVITAYNSGKVLFQGKAPEIEAERWGNEGSSNTVEKKSKPQSIYAPSPSLFSSSHIGSDEAGTGDYFGPITVACAYVKEHDIPILKELGVKDSKNLTDDTIVRLSKEIVKLKIPYSLLILHNKKYNALQKKGWSQGKMKTMLHHSAINKLLQKIEDNAYEGILVDQFCEPAVYKKHLATERHTLNDKTYFMTKAESYSIAVATGSIIARASFVKEMDKISEQLGVSIKKGASRHVDQQIAKIISEHGEGKLNEVAKVHFANTQKARKYM
ncbi:ribonuclease HIII [Ornithinibacillus halophilus]|uniref:Ribonuclease HIII n=1 Tax=Ornithinibacillus halophilus TaxID=930117 RepID=A0A1M5NF02_9BACI|nr:ribonuclease HIII [Ornithinibacillus halophilus]SHG88017.1 ribonuclease HIII [Ornithinibacillus halophilus]